ncbi:MAG: winged helix-turn-helix domain-containing protein [Candidatus Bathyarchaeia archaeon]|jgi:predicted transcriptional regulator
MGKYRDMLGIIADMLHAAGSGSKKTRIMGVANLSYRLFEKYLGRTVQAGFLRLNGEGYEVTEKGQDFLVKYLALSSKYSMVESELQSVMYEREVLKRMCQPSRNGKLKAMCGGKRRK